MALQTSSIGIRKWAAEGGGATLEWERGAGDQRMRGWLRADGTRAIETNGNPLFSEDNNDFDFEAIWDAEV